MNTRIVERLEKYNISPTQAAVTLILFTILVLAGLNMKYNDNETIDSQSYERTACELAKYQTNATLYYNETVNACVKPGSGFQYNYPVNSSG